MDFLSPVLNLIGTLLVDEYSRINGISDTLKTWGEKLPTIQAVLDSAEEKQMSDDRATVLWLADLRDVAYDMEDLLDMFSVDAKQDASKVQARSRSSKLPHCLIACCSRFRPRTLISGHRMANEIKDINRRLDQVLNRIPALQLVQNLRSRSHNNLPRFITTSLTEPKFVGREKQMEELLARLTGSEATDHSVRSQATDDSVRSQATDDSFRPFRVVSIVGMGGLGKTTLAQELYNHESLKNADFAVKAWVCVSEVFDMAAITKSILHQVLQSFSGVDKDLNQLQNSLKDKLSGKKFLIVLDDVWNEKYDEIASLLKPLYSGSKGSRILLTTRKFEVARLMGDRYPKQLDFLSSEDCLSLLAYHSISEQNFERHPHLHDIAVKLANKCKGLPLSIKTIGGLLHLKSDVESWNGVLAHEIWDKKGMIPPALKLSYILLPIHLKRCFAACALFPKDYMFDQDELIRLWIVQGLLQKETAKTFREVGMENLNQLEAVSFLLKAKDKKNFYSMHDLVNDLAKSIDTRSFFSSDEYKEGSISREESLDKVRHAAMVTQRFECCISRRFDVYRRMKKLRTFMAFQVSEDPEPNVTVSQDVIQDLIMDMNNLKMLSLRYFGITHVPDQIGEMKLLRSIDVSHTHIEMLPESICDLVELQSLLLRRCRELKKLPRNIHKLANLLHLDITGTDSLQEMPSRIGDLTNLEILSDFVVGKEAGQELKQLGPLGCLQRELHIRNLLDVDDVEDARIANISRKEGILEISLDWGSSSEISHEDDHQFKLLDHLQPPRKIESLEIRHYGAKRLPSWFECCMNNVLRITLTGCRSVDSLPPFGQLPLLQRLDISGFEAVSSIGPEFYGSGMPSFRSLRSLSFEDMGAWEKWSSHGEDDNEKPFPCLHQLVVKECPKLKGGCSTLSLPSLIEIDIYGCDGGLLKCLAGLTSMTKMVIGRIEKLVHFEGSLSTSWVALEEMRIMSCPRFKSFVEGDDGGRQVPPKLKILKINGSEDIEKLPDDLCELTSLNEIDISECKKLCSFPSKGLPPSLRILDLYRCPRLPQSELISSRLPDSLRFLSLWNLEGVVSMTEIVAVGSPLSPSLRELKIRDCRSLTTLSDSLQHMSALSNLLVENCHALEMDVFPVLPCNLSRFILYSCPKVKSLPNDMHHLTSLKELTIEGCEGITTFTNSLQHLSALSKFTLENCRELEMDRFPALPCNLSSFSLARCPKVKSLPDDMHHLTSLKELTVEFCEGITRLSPSGGGLPPNLELLSIERCRNLNQPIWEWGLRGLTALRVLRIWGGIGCVDEMECFPPDDDADWSRLLPSSLLNLSIGKMKKLERMGGGLRHHLTSLQTLYISNCERLRCLPDDGLPESLEYLIIRGCSPSLVKKCRKGKGKYWPHLRLIPEIVIP